MSSMTSGSRICLMSVQVLTGRSYSPHRTPCGIMILSMNDDSDLTACVPALVYGRSVMIVPRGLI